MKVKHSKFKNTGILFELLVRQITADSMVDQNSKALGLIKKFFMSSELAKENKLYQSLVNSEQLNEQKANVVISTILDQSSKINRVKLNKEKFNLIKEIKFDNLTVMTFEYEFDSQNKGGMGSQYMKNSEAIAKITGLQSGV